MEQFFWSLTFENIFEKSAILCHKKTLPPGILSVTVKNLPCIKNIRKYILCASDVVCNIYMYVLHIWLWHLMYTHAQTETHIHTHKIWLSLKLSSRHWKNTFPYQSFCKIPALGRKHLKPKKKRFIFSPTRLYWIFMKLFAKNNIIFKSLLWKYLLGLSLN